MNLDSMSAPEGKAMDRFLKWHELLQLAPNVKAVNAIMRDYAHSLAPVAGTLPSECQQALAMADLDVQAAAVLLLRAELAFQGSAEAREFLHEVAHTFASAAVRITLLHAKPVVPSV
jgi:hypothetical protein